MKFSLRSIFWLVTVAGFGCWLLSFPPAGVPHVEPGINRIPSAFEMMDLLAMVAADRIARLLVCVVVFFLPSVLLFVQKRCEHRFFPSPQQKLQ
jgi:hypothetical protein